MLFRSEDKAYRRNQKSLAGIENLNASYGSESET